MIDIHDIAIALSREARFNGHTTEFYSVAQHSLFVSNLLPPDNALEGLLHDATEAYMRDIPSPLKKLLFDYQKLEKRMDRAIRKKFGLPPIMSKIVKDCDLLALWHEMHSFTQHEVPSTYPYLIPLTSEQAYSAFIARYKELISKGI